MDKDTMYVYDILPDINQYLITMYTKISGKELKVYRYVPMLSGNYSIKDVLQYIHKCAEELNDWALRHKAELISDSATAFRMEESYERNN